MKDDISYLKHILEAVEIIETYLDGVDFGIFAKDRKTIDATVRELEIIGEAANYLSDEFKQSHQKIPFRDMTDMRNILIHEYFGVDPNIVWGTCKNDLPTLKQTITDYLYDKSAGDLNR